MSFNRRISDTFAANVHESKNNYLLSHDTKGIDFWRLLLGLVVPYQQHGIEIVLEPKILPSQIREAHSHTLFCGEATRAIDDDLAVSRS